MLWDAVAGAQGPLTAPSPSLGKAFSSFMASSSSSSSPSSYSPPLCNFFSVLFPQARCVLAHSVINRSFYRGYGREVPIFAYLVHAVHLQRFLVFISWRTHSSDLRRCDVATSPSNCSRGKLFFGSSPTLDFPNSFRYRAERGNRIAFPANYRAETLFFSAHSVLAVSLQNCVVFLHLMNFL